MKKYIIIGGSIGLILPILSLFPNVPIPSWSIPVLVPFRILMGSASSVDISNLYWKIFTVIGILNIGLYALLGLIVGSIIRACKKTHLKQLILMFIIGF